MLPILYTGKVEKFWLKLHLSRANVGAVLFKFVYSGPVGSQLILMTVFHLFNVGYLVFIM